MSYRMEDESRMAWIGTWFTKEFDGVVFKGAVMSYSAPYYEILYQDGDVEEVSFTELQKLLATERKRIRKAEMEQRSLEMEQKVNIATPKIKQI